jgi:choline dehydrogenase
VPQAHLNGRRIFSPRGRVLGGTSSINFMMYVRGNRLDFDHWRDLGNTGWGYDDVLPYFRRSEGNREFNNHYHGTGGPLTVSSYTKPHPWGARFIDAAQQNGMPLNPDFNGANQHGCGFYQATIRDGQRCSAALAFLEPAKTRPNLTIQTHATVLKILIENNCAVGLEYLRRGVLEHARAASEVVLCGGAFNSPHLLMLSGIGHARELEMHGIQVKLDLPGVGKNLQDHLAVPVGCEMTQQLSMGAMSTVDRQAAMAQYDQDRTGPMASNLFEVGGFASVTDYPTWPELQYLFNTSLPKLFPEAPPQARHGVAVACYVNRPASRGEVTLASADPLARPVIDPCYLSDPRDVEIAVMGLRRSLAILGATPFESIRGAPQHGLNSSDTDAVLEAYVRERATTTWHVSGTCRMGMDAKAVVSADLKVKGIAQLRVADASVMPKVVSGNTNAAVIMIAEKAADFMLAH